MNTSFFKCKRKQLKNTVQSTLNWQYNVHLSANSIVLMHYYVTCLNPCKKSSQTSSTLCCFHEGTVFIFRLREFVHNKIMYNDICIFKTRLGGEICLLNVIMKQGYLRFLHFFNYFRLTDPSSPPLGNSNPFCKGSMDIFWNCTMYIKDETKSQLPI